MREMLVRCTSPGCGMTYRVSEAVRGRMGRCTRCKCKFLLAPQAVAATVAEPEPVPATAPEADAPTGWQPGGTILGLYEVRGVLGEGGMGKVYRVHHKEWNLDLAVKTPRAEILSRPGAVENFEREAETWVNLGLHPHIVTCYYVRRIDELPRVFAELVEGGSLHNWIEDGRLYRDGPEQSLIRILDIAIQFAWGLHHSHEQGLVHQDVKPHNVMMTPEGVAKVTDFGLAKARSIAGEPTPTAAGQSILVSSGGMTPAYCSPEQAGRQKLSRRTDLWSWAVSLLEMFTGGVTWMSGAAANEALTDYLETGPPEPTLPRMPEKLAELLRRCLQPQAEDRPSDLHEPADVLQAIYRDIAGRDYPRREPRPAELLATGLNNKGVSLHDLGKYDAAEAAWDQALQADPHHPEAAHNLGLSRWRSVFVTDTELLQQIEAVRQSRPEEWLPALLIARVHVERGDCAAAIAVLEGLKEKAAEEGEVKALLASARQLLSRSRHALVPAAAKARQAEGRYQVRINWQRLDVEDSASAWSPRLEGHKETIRDCHLSPDGRVIRSSGGCWAAAPQWNQPAPLVLSRLRSTQATLSSAETFARAMEQARQAIERKDTAAAVRAVREARSQPGFERHADALALWGQLYPRCNFRALQGVWNERTFVGHQGAVTSLSWRIDGLYAVSGSEDKTLRVWDIATGQEVGRLLGAPMHRDTESLSPDGRLAVSAHFSPSQVRLLLWDLATGAHVRTLDGHTEPIGGCLGWSSDGRFLVSGGDDRTARLWDVGTGRCLGTFKGHSDSVIAVACNRDASLVLSSAAGGAVRLWDGSTGKPLRTLRGHRGDVDAFAWSEDDGHVLSGGDDHTVRLWEMPSGRCLRTFSGHTDAVEAVAWSPDGGRALSGSKDGTVRLWDLDTGRCLRVFEGHSSWVSALLWSPDGRQAFSGPAGGVDLESRSQPGRVARLPGRGAAVGSGHRDLRAGVRRAAGPGDGRGLEPRGPVHPVRQCWRAAATIGCASGTCNRGKWCERWKNTTMFAPSPGARPAATSCRRGRTNR